eukprot:45974-Amphidinium_carterae.1
MKYTIEETKNKEKWHHYFAWFFLPMSSMSGSLQRHSFRRPFELRSEHEHGVSLLPTLDI